MTTREGAEKTRAELERRFKSQTELVATALTRDGRDWRVVIYVREGAELPDELIKLAACRSEGVDLVPSGSLTLE